ncbi:MAG TPA: Gfo/Idh/MocA family oxidoreductase [Solirubrobacteraceae bacterium]
MSSGAVGIGMLGCGFMAQAHSFALRALASVAPSDPQPALMTICGREPEQVDTARRRLGFARGVTDWRLLLDDDRVEVLDDCAPNHLHPEPVVAAAARGKHVFCEKPLATSAGAARAMWVAAERAGIVHMCGFNFRFFPAIRRAREMLEAGDLGELTHFRARFLASSALSDDQRWTWRFRRATAGTGALGDLGSHLIDLARYLVGEPTSVAGILRTFVPERDGGLVDVDDAFLGAVEFEGGALGTLEASRVAGRRSNTCAFEVDGTRGSLGFDGERLNELEVHRERKATVRMEVTSPRDPFMELWWPSPGHALGWGDSFTHEMHHLLCAVRGDGVVAPHGADFADGYRCAEVCDAISRSAVSGQRERVAYRELDDQHGGDASSTKR